MSSLVENILKNKINVMLSEEDGLINLIGESVFLTQTEDGSPNLDKAYEDTSYKLSLVKRKLSRTEFNGYLVQMYGEPDDGE